MKEISKCVIIAREKTEGKKRRDSTSKEHRTRHATVVRDYALLLLRPRFFFRSFFFSSLTQIIHIKSRGAILLVTSMDIKARASRGVGMYTLEYGSLHLDYAERKASSLSCLCAIGARFKHAATPDRHVYCTSGERYNANVTGSIDAIKARRRSLRFHIFALEASAASARR